jgi:Uncharacterized conserved protein
MTNETHVLGKCTLKSEEIKQDSSFKESLYNLAQYARKQPGCLDYSILDCENIPNVYYIHSIWASKKELQQYWNPLQIERTNQLIRLFMKDCKLSITHAILDV